MELMRLLRYNSRHDLYFARDGHWPQLNPLSSSSQGKNGKPTYRFYEPIWLWRLRKYLFCRTGRQRCASREQHPHISKYFGDSVFPDSWDRGPDGYRTCSYCGSIHPEDLMDICRKTVTDERYSVDGTDKGYKVYVRQPGVRNASEGAIKFYMWHAAAKPSQAEQDLFKQARSLSNDRFWTKRAANVRAVAKTN